MQKSNPANHMWYPILWGLVILLQKGLCMYDKMKIIISCSGHHAIWKYTLFSVLLRTAICSVCRISLDTQMYSPLQLTQLQQQHNTPSWTPDEKTSLPFCISRGQMIHRRKSIPIYSNIDAHAVRTEILTHERKG